MSYPAGLLHCTTSVHHTALKGVSGTLSHGHIAPQMADVQEESRSLATPELPVMAYHQGHLSLGPGVRGALCALREEYQQDKLEMTRTIQ